MPPKPEPQPQSETKPEKKTGTVICGLRSPGPKYRLKTLVGYQEHCLSRYRNPAYTFGFRHPFLQTCEGPGPKYLIKDPKREGFSFGLVGKSFDTTCGPGPKYILPVPKGPAFSLKFRTKHRGSCGTPGPYFVQLLSDSPAFSIGKRLPALKCDAVPGPSPYSVDLVTIKAPEYSIAVRHGEKVICRSPGPKYNVKSPRPNPKYSFGVKHSECAPPYIVECDEQC
ncbi:outer dense fiber protein 3-like [Hylaeus volcanicus]|uniref:outer dense fiber protein 3-like n=1 Tax=Hylaeus volcanicus TaxID=313075 RepID=UPI0023B82C67|nr:outer dense fiber protein 3-like [Hylaeus volcanicus]